MAEPSAARRGAGWSDEIPVVALEVYRPVDPAHSAKVHQIIRDAADQVCRPLDDRDLRRKIAYMHCVDEDGAVARAIAQLSHTAVPSLPR
jgi:hypothetical protein